jgi:hypothetical protein
MPFWKRGRSDRTPDREVLVLGHQLAEAAAREEQHRAAIGDVRSPLGEARYDASSGALDLHRFVESPVDAVVGQFVAAWESLAPAEAQALRAALSMDDLYTLLAFIRRSALASLQGRRRPSRLPRWISGGLIGATPRLPLSCSLGQRREQAWTTGSSSRRRRAGANPA